MRRLVAILLAVLLSCMLCNAQRVSDSGYRTVGFIKSDGTVQDSGYRTIGHTSDVPMEWAALYFFFKL